jgi:integrase
MRQPALTIDMVVPALERLAVEPKTTVSDHQMAWRDRFVLTILSRTSLSVGDLARARMADVIVTQDSRISDGWVLAMEGRNPQPLDLEVVEVFRNYRQAFRLRPQPSRDEVLGLILSPYTRANEADVRSGNAGARRLRLQWKSITSRQAVWAIAQEALRRSAH